MSGLAGLLRRVRDDAFLRTSLLLFVLLNGANLLNYVFQVVMARLLSPAEFGLLLALLSLFIFFAIPMGAIETSVAHFVARREPPTDAGSLVAIRRFAWGAAVLLAAMLAAGASWLGARLAAPPTLVVMIGFAVAFMPLTTFYAGRLQGLGRFPAFGASPMAAAASRLGVGVLLVAAGLGVQGAVAATLLAAFVGFVLMMRPAPKLPDAPAAPLGPFFAYAGPSLLGLLGIAGLANLDVVAVRHYFSEADAGIYAGAAVVGRIMLFFPAAIAMVLLPAASRAQSHEERVRLLGKALAASLVLSGSIVLVAWAVPELVARVVLGAGWSEAAPLLPWITLVMLFVNVVSLLTFYLLGIRRTWAASVLPAFVVGELVGFWLFHDALIEIVTTMGVAALLASLLGLWAALAPTRKVGASPS